MNLNRLTPEGHPAYSEGDKVIVSLDNGQTTLAKGTIVGNSVLNEIGVWIVKVDFNEPNTIDRTVYPFSCIAVPHVCLCPYKTK